MRHKKNQIITDATMLDASNVLDGELVARTEAGHPEILLKMSDGLISYQEQSCLELLTLRLSSLAKNLSRSLSPHVPTLAIKIDC